MRVGLLVMYIYSVGQSVSQSVSRISCRVLITVSIECEDLGASWVLIACKHRDKGMVVFGGVSTAQRDGTRLDSSVKYSIDLDIGYTNKCVPWPREFGVFPFRTASKNRFKALHTRNSLAACVTIVST